MKIITILGTRPEIIKMSSVLPLFDKNFQHLLIHTDQHYSYELDKLMFEQLKLRAPDYRLATDKRTAAIQTGDMILKISEILEKEKPDLVIVHGDTNSTLAGAISANKLKIKLAHIEAGCRMFDYSMPEEFNRIVVDHLADILFAPDEIAVRDLKNENIQTSRVKLVGSTVFDCINRNKQFANRKILQELGLEAGKFVVATLHRQESVDNPEILKELLSALDFIGGKIKIVFPIHPRTQKNITTNNILIGKNIITTPPLGYFEFLALLQDCRFVMSDSGGIMEEGFACGKPCLYLHNTPAWPRLINAGKNILATTNKENIIKHAEMLLDNNELNRIKAIPCDSDAGASDRIIKHLKTQ